MIANFFSNLDLVGVLTLVAVAFALYAIVSYDHDKGLK